MNQNIKNTALARGKRIKNSKTAIDFYWLQQEFRKLHVEHAMILKRIDEIELPRLISPELEKQINLAHAIAWKIDRQVPDKNVPPNK